MSLSLSLQELDIKSKLEDALIENKRLQDRFYSLEFYAKTNTNSNVFDNLNGHSGENNGTNGNNGASSSNSNGNNSKSLFQCNYFTCPKFF